MKHIHNPHDERLIHDILPSDTAWQGRQLQTMQHASIGMLDDIWQQQSRRSAGAAGVISRPMADLSYTRLQPLATYRDTASVGLYEFQSSKITLYITYVKARMGAQIRCIRNDVGRHMAAMKQRFLHGLRVGSMRVSVWLGLSRWTWRPTKYTAQHGVKTNWNTRTMRWSKRYASPVAGLLAIILVVVLTWPIGPMFFQSLHHTARPTAYETPASVAPPVPTTPPSNSTNSTHSSHHTPPVLRGLVTKVPAANAVSKVLSSVTSTTDGATTAVPVVGGMGGGDGTTTPTDPTIPTDGGTSNTGGGSDDGSSTPIVTVPPVTIPGVTVTVGGDPIVTTPDLNLGLN